MEFDAGRRALILAGLGIAVGGCASNAPQAEPSGRTAPSPRATGAPMPSPTFPRPRPSPTLPTRDEIIARFGGQEPQYWGLDVPGVVARMPSTSGGAALTLDYCGGPEGSQTDHAILNLLRENGVPATLFLNARWISSNPVLAKELAEEPLFEIANHGTQHLPLSVNGRSAYGISGTTGPGEVFDEIMANTHMISEITGKPPRFFRSGTAHLDEVASRISLALGQVPLGFSINGDAGATHPSHIVAQEIAAAHSGDIIIAHGNQPAAATGSGLAAALPLLQTKFIQLNSAGPRG